MLEYEVNVTRQALAQMREITHYISFVLMAPDTAKQWLATMNGKLSGLSILPKRYPLVKEKPWRNKGIRSMTVNNFLVYYWVDERNARVQITSVIYKKRDQQEQLSNMILEDDQ